MAYFNHAFNKLFVGTHPTQAASGTAKAVDFGFLDSLGVPSVQLHNIAAPYGLGVGVYGLFYQDPVLGLASFNAGGIIAGKPAILASTALYQRDKISNFDGGYQESTKSKLINPKYVTRFNRIDPCTANNNVIHVGKTPFTSAGTLTLTLTDGGTGYTDGVYANVPLIDTVSSGNSATANLTIVGGIITVATINAPGEGYTIGNTLHPSPAVVGTPTLEAILTVATVGLTGATCCKEFLCDETYFLRIDVKGSPELRYLSRNGYWTADYYTGCCPTDCGVPSPVDSTLVFIAWANQIINNAIVGPFVLPVVYDESGTAWYVPGTPGLFNNSAVRPGVATVSILSGGTNYTDGVYENVLFQNSGSGAGVTATVTVAGGVVTVVAVTSKGLGYVVGDVLTSAQLEQNAGGAGASFSVATLITPTWDNYVSPGHVDGACAGMKLTGAFIDTKFGDCTFYPSDFFEKQPVNIYASEVDETGDPCAFEGLCVVTQCAPRQGNGFGETVVRDLILSESYMQNYFYNGNDLRIREVTQGYDVTAAINRSLQYTRYQILHSVPRFNNPSGTFDNDQYLLEIITAGISVSFEATVAAFLSACGCGTELEVIACGPACS